ncbi:MAG TPA: hypothetical protein VIH37_05405 [Candidatus Limnocylindrales bacterium]
MHRTTWLPAVAALVVAACSAAMPPPTPTSNVVAAPGGDTLSVANGTTVPVAIAVNGPTIGTVAPGETQDWGQAALPAKPWAVLARSPSGRVLATLRISPTDFLSSTSGRVASADLACGRLVLWAGAPTTGGPTFVPDPSRPCDGAGIDEARAGQIARDYFATAHGPGVRLSKVTETDLGLANDTACGAAWEVLMKGTVTEGSGAPTDPTCTSASTRPLGP